MKPVKLDLQKESLENFKKNNSVSQVIDYYEEILKELFLIKNPPFRFNPNYQKEQTDFISGHLQGKSIEEAGSWFYFPWNKILAHYLPDEFHQEIRTARNKNIISKEEQNKFYNFNVGIAGLSVGSHAATTLAMMGASRIIKLADPDEISGSNLNRIRYDYTKVGINKCDLAEQFVYQVNPYAEVYSYSNGITPENILEFLNGPPKLDALIEELDNLEMKIRLRLEARKLGIPVIMATDNGDNVIVDIERYDLDPNLKLFNGVAGDLTFEEFQKFPPQELPRLATKIAGPGVVVPKMLSSLMEVGKTLYSWPQLGDAATLSGVAIAYVVKKLSLGEKIKSGKLEVNLDSIFDPDYEKDLAKREEEKNKYLKMIGL